MDALILKTANELVIEEVPLPSEVTGNDVLIKHGRIGDFEVKDPMILGHESAGIVEKVGPHVNDLKVGDKVALEPATPPYHGTLTKYYILPVDFCHLLPSSLTLKEACIMEPLSVAVQAIRQLGNSLMNRTIVVFGAGPVGLLVMGAAKAYGAKVVSAVDIFAARLEYALKFKYATHTYTASILKEGQDEDEYARQTAKDIYGEEKFDFAIDASGAPSAVMMGVYCLKAGGTYVQVGNGKPVVSIPISYVVNNQITIRGSFRYANCYPEAIHLVSSGLLDVKDLITHEFSFEDSAKAYQTVKDGGIGVLKVLIRGVGVEKAC